MKKFSVKLGNVLTVTLLTMELKFKPRLFSSRAYVLNHYAMLPHSSTMLQRTENILIIYIFKLVYLYNYIWLPRRYNGKESACQCRRYKRCGFDP